MVRRHEAFLDRGNEALAEMQAIDARLEAIKAAVAAEFPLSPAEVETFRARLADRVMAIHDVEAATVAAMRAAMA